MNIYYMRRVGFTLAAAPILALALSIAVVDSTPAFAQPKPHAGKSTSRPSSKPKSVSRRPSASKPSAVSTRRNVNIDNSRKTNINVNSRHTTVVMPPRRPYSRPPYYYGGRRYYGYHPYHYHPYHPYHYGPTWHPFGFFVATLAVTAVVVSVNNAQYHYDQGVFYQQSGSGYTVVAAPSGATVTTIPQNSQTVVVNETNNYYYGGTYYEKSGEKYTVVDPPAGAVVDNLPEGAKEEKIGDQTYMVYNGTYYQPVQVDGKDKYEVSYVEEEQQQ